MKQEQTILFILFLFACCDGYNLFGEAGQAYSIEIHIGSPPQKLNVIVDTGSTTLAIAAYSRHGNDKYFIIGNSSTVIDSGKEVHARYSQGMWVGRHVSDYIKFPSLSDIPRMRSDLVAITDSHKFFMNGSGWQGLLGLAYPPVGAWGDGVLVGSWLDSDDCGKCNAFHLELCGPQSVTNSTHYGTLSMIADTDEMLPFTYRTPILHKRWYEVGVLGVSFADVAIERMDNPNDQTEITLRLSCDDDHQIDLEACVILNAEKSIVDSGTTNIRLPYNVFDSLVEKVSAKALLANVSIPHDFFEGEAVCWFEQLEWSWMPWMAVDLLSSESDNAYFTLFVPPENFLRIVTVKSDVGSNTSQYCYKFGVEAGGKDTVLGYTAMEGLKVLFNRTGGWIGFTESECGPRTFIKGPKYVPYSLKRKCELNTGDLESISIKTAQWVLLIVSIIAASVLVYILLPFFKYLIFKRSRRLFASTSTNALFESQDLS